MVNMPNSGGRNTRGANKRKGVEKYNSGFKNVQTLISGTGMGLIHVNFIDRADP